MKIFILLAAFFSNTLMAASDLAMQTKLDSESDEESTLVSVLFKEKAPLGETKVEEHGTFIQVKIPKTIVANTGKFYDGNSPYIRKIAIFQIDDTTAGIRLFVTQDTDTIVPALSTETLSDRLLIHIDHKIVKVPHIDDSPPVEKIIASTEVRKDIKDPAKLVKENKEKELVESSDLKESVASSISKEDLENIAIMLAVIIPLMIMSLLVRRVMSRSKKGDVQGYPMKTLASYSLAPKQNLTLVEVGKQQILLGVSPDGINYLTSISDQKEAAQEKPVHRAMPIHQNTTLPKPRMQKEVLRKPLKQSSELQRNRVSKTEPSDNQSSAIRDRNSYDRTGKSKTISDESRSIEDVTNLIRSKLKDLPNI